MASVEQIKALSALGREMELTGAALNTFVSDRLSEITKEREAAERGREREAEEREKERITAEKDFLVQQINPHFLFNTLNNIYSLSIDNNPKASEAILQLSKMLDYSLYGNKKDFTSIANEIQYINNFIGLFKLKDEEINNIFFTYKVASNIKIAPMMEPIGPPR